MFSYTVITDQDKQFIEAAYYTVEDGLVTFKDDDHKQVASISQHRLISLVRGDTRVERPKYDEAIPLRISKGLVGEGPESYSIILGNTELSLHLLAQDGFKLEMVPIAGDGGPSVPQVTLVLAPGAVNVDIEAELLAYLRSSTPTA